MVTLNIDDKPGLLKALEEGRVEFSGRAPKSGRTPWGLIVTIVVAILGWLFAAAGVGAGDYSRVRDRVTTLETQRDEDVRRAKEQREDDARWRDRVDNKLDRLIEQLGRQGRQP